jgi:hypothetical protein
MKGEHVAMKRKLPIAIGAFVLFGGLGYIVPRLVSASNARPLYGNFDMGMKCMGGHEIFLYLDGSGAYENCPGHRDMSPMGPIARSAASVTILHAKDSTPWLRIDYDGSVHQVTRVRDGRVYDLPQVSNPWRTWFPKLLPEE